MQLMVYPNPVTGKQQVTIAINGSNAKSKTIEMLTMQFSTVLNENFTGNTFTMQNASGPGIYVVKVNTGMRCCRGGW